MKTRSIRQSHALLVIGSVLPIVVMGTFVLFGYYRGEQSRLADAAISRARAVTSAVDREVGTTQAALRVLATSPLLAKNDLAEFHARAAVALPALNAEILVLVNRTGQVVLTTSQPWGTPLPKLVSTPLLDRILKTGQPGLSDLFLGTIAGKLIYTVGVPVTLDGVIVYTLNGTASPTHMLEVLSEQKLPDSWRAAVIDSSGSVVARTHDMNKFLGSKVTPELLKRLSASNEGSFETTSLDGIPNITAYSRSAVTGWTVAIGAPLAELKEDIRQTLTQLLAAAFLALGLGFIIASAIGSRIAAAFTDLIKPARELGMGKLVDAPRSPIKEADEVGVALLDAAKVLEEANRAKADFISSMSHELRTPLNAILGFAQLLESSPTPLTPAQKHDTERILSAGWHLLALVNELLDLAQIEGGKGVVSWDSVSLADVMLESQSLVEPLAQKRGIAMRFPHFDIPYFVKADRTRLKQILINLLSNAVKYNRPEGSVSVECTLATPGSIRIGVRDTGAGLTPEQVAQLFQPFNRLGRNADTDEGTGIGLVLSKRLVEMMGGAIGAESTVGVGSVFWIELALAAAPPGIVGEAAQAEPEQAPTHHGEPQKTVLYVEDNEASLALVEALIERQPDLQLLTAADGHAGVELARTFVPAVILMDMNLPGMNGLQAMQTLRADPTTAHIPVIAVSAVAMPIEIERALEAGFFSYLTKPIKLKEFMVALEVAIKFSQARSAPADPKIK